VNRGSAKASDIVALKDEVQRGVKETFGVELHPEPVFLGFETV
jgi:UDP-N-acetylmuramate dehydrogenase